MVTKIKKEFLEGANVDLSFIPVGKFPTTYGYVLMSGMDTTSGVLMRIDTFIEDENQVVLDSSSTVFMPNVRLVQVEETGAIALYDDVRTRDTLMEMIENGKATEVPLNVEALGNYVKDNSEKTEVVAENETTADDGIDISGLDSSEIAALIEKKRGNTTDKVNKVFIGTTEENSEPVHTDANNESANETPLTTNDNADESSNDWSKDAEPENSTIGVTTCKDSDADINNSLDVEDINKLKALQETLPADNSDSVKAEADTEKEHGHGKHNKHKHEKHSNISWNDDSVSSDSKLFESILK